MSGDSPSGASAGSHSGSLDAKLKHLEFIQGVIARMSNSSFLFKGWAITIAAGLSAFAATSSQSVLRVALIGAIVSSVLFWGIDCSTETEKSKPACNWLTSCRRPHLVSFYGLIVTGEVVGLLLIKRK